MNPKPQRWTEQSPEPKPWPTVVDEDGVTWRPVDEDGLGHLTYHQQKIVHLAGGGATTGTLAGDWRDLWDYLPGGTTLREAVGEEVDTWIETWAEAPPVSKPETCGDPGAIPFGVLINESSVGWYRPRGRQ